MPILRSNFPLVWYNRLQIFTETFDAVWQECNSFRSGINEPSQDDFECSPCGVPLLHLLDRRRFLAKGGIVIGERAKFDIEQAEKDVFDPSEGQLVALHETTKIVYVDIPVP